MGAQSGLPRGVPKYLGSERMCAKVQSKNTRKTQKRTLEGPQEALEFPTRIVERFSSGEVGRALDLGCAVGRSAFEMSRTAAEVVAIDYSQVFVDASRCNHPTISHENDAIDAETFPCSRHDLRERRRVCCIARKHLDRDRPAVGIAQLSVHNLWSISAVIATVAVFDQRTYASRVVT